jgi:hypothetical protein
LRERGRGERKKERLECPTMNFFTFIKWVEMLYFEASAGEINGLIIAEYN